MGGNQREEEIRKIERLLYRYPELCAEVELRLEQEFSPPVVSAVDYSRPQTSKTNRFFSMVEQSAKRLDQMDRTLMEKMRLCYRIEVALSALTERQYKVVDLRYWKKLDFAEIAARMDYSRTTLYEAKREAVEKLQRVGLARDYNQKKNAS